MMRTILGILLIAVPILFLGWRAHRKGYLIPALQGMAIGLVIVAWVTASIYLIAG